MEIVSTWKCIIRFHFNLKLSNSVISLQGSSRGHTDPDLPTSVAVMLKSDQYCRVNRRAVIFDKHTIITNSDLLTCLHVKWSLWERFNYNVFFSFCPLSAVWIKTLTWEIQYGAMPQEIQPIFCPVRFWTVGTDSPIKKTNTNPVVEDRYGAFFSLSFQQTCCHCCYILSFCRNCGFGVFVFD